jgi:hypothetical protein
MSYEFDVFLSYRREKPSESWVHDHFLPYFKPALGDALARPAQVFVDRTGIRAGQKWPARLKQALAHSRCLLGIWSPLYFWSEWCQCESAVMRHRELQLGFGTNANPNGLIIGIKVNDGIHFPDFARESHRVDFEPYFFDGPAFNQSPLHIEFQRAVRLFAADAAHIVKSAPAWSAEWATAPWMDDIVATVQTPASPKVSQPLLS